MQPPKRCRKAEQKPRALEVRLPRGRAGAARGSEILRSVYAELTRRGCRSTKPRSAIIASLAASRRYLTANELHRCLPVRLKAGLATVYRTLEMLHAIGAASTAVRPSGETAYLFCPIQHHHHAVCTRCGRVDDLPCRSSVGLTRKLAERLDFTVAQHRLEFFGTCARCS